jgi:hypothetical protein
MPNGTVYLVTFEPFCERIKNVEIEVSDYSATPDKVKLLDRDDGKRWSFDISDVPDCDDEDEDSENGESDGDEDNE